VHGDIDMKLLLKIALISVLFADTVCAQPSSQVAWTPETLNLVRKGNKEKGKELAANCTVCHGEKGVSSITNTPSLAGQLSTYTFKQLQDYKSGSRSNEVMAPIASSLSDQDMADLGAWFASLPAPGYKAATEPSETAEQLVTKGDGKRTIPSCFVCHGRSGDGEKMDIPALAGQQADYLAATLKAYKNGSRHNDIYSRMRLISEQLSEYEIEELSKYYQQMSQR
jgi:cytochrome c553